MIPGRVEGVGLEKRVEVKQGLVVESSKSEVEERMQAWVAMGGRHKTQRERVWRTYVVCYGETKKKISRAPKAAGCDCGVSAYNPPIPFPPNSPNFFYFFLSLFLYAILPFKTGTIPYSYRYHSPFNLFG